MLRNRRFACLGVFFCACSSLVGQASTGAGGVGGGFAITSGDGLQLQLTHDGAVSHVRQRGVALPLSESVGGLYVTDVKALLEPIAGEKERAPNPSFEMDSDANGFPDGWEFVDFWGSGGSASWDSNVATDGTQSIRIDGTGGEAIWTSPISVAESTRWILQIERKGDAPVRVLAFWYDGSFSSIGLELGEEQPPTAEFTPLAQVVAAPLGARYLRLGFQALGGSTTWLDLARWVRPQRSVFQRLDGPVIAQGPMLSQHTELRSMQIAASWSLHPAAHGVRAQLWLEDRSGVDRSLDVDFVLPLRTGSLRFQGEPRQDLPIGEQNVYGEYQSFENSLEVPFGHGLASVYSLMSVTTRNRDAGLALGVPPDSAVPVRLHLDTAPGGGLRLSSPLGITWVREARPGTAVLEFFVCGVEPELGFRSALQQMEELHPALAERRFGTGGIWMPFTAPSSIPAVEDFHFAVHEGANSVAEDDALGILSFVYIEPWNYWLDLGDFSGPPTYGQALTRLQQQAAGGGFPAEWTAMARATFVGGHRDASGNFLHQILQRPWISGSGWSMLCSHSPESGLEDLGGQSWPAPFEVQSAFVQSAYDDADAAGAVLDGTYLDSMQTYFGDTLDQRREQWRAITTPLTWDPQSRDPALWPPAQVAAAARDHASREHASGGLVMGNAIHPNCRPAALSIDYLGIEADWGSGPESDATLLWRRIAAWRKPFCILQNTDFSQFDHATMERYMARCLAYGIFASCFSADASTDPYWEDPALYERDRDLFKKYVSLVQELDSAGWRPIPHARSDRNDVYTERFGSGPDPLYFTWWNDRDTLAHAALAVDKGPLGLASVNAVRDLIDDRLLAFTQDALQVVVTDTLEVGAVRMIQFE